MVKQESPVKMIDHYIDVHGPKCHGEYASPDATGIVLSRIQMLTRDSVRMSVLHSSRKSGRSLRGLEKSWQILAGPQTAGPDNATRLRFRATPLGDAAPSLFEQHKLWPSGPSPDDTAFDIAARLIADIDAGVKESDRYDTDLLRRISKFGSVFRRGIDYLEFGGHKVNHAAQPRFDRTISSRAEAWIGETPDSRRVRVAGRMDAIRVSDQIIELILNDGQRIRAVWTGKEVVGLRDFLTRKVVIEGQAVFRPTGSLLRIDTEVIRVAEKSDDFFSALPTATGIELLSKQARVPQFGDSGAAAIFGKWPGDESDAELVAAIEELS